MSVVGETFVSVHAISASLEKEIAAQAKVAATRAEQALKIKPSVNTAGAKQEFDKLGHAVENANGHLNKTGKAVGPLGVLMGNLRAKLHTVAEEGGPVSRQLASIAEGATALGPEFLAVAGAAAIVVGALVVGGEAFVKFAEDVHKFQLVSGASAETSSRFVVALRLLGVEPARVGAALFRLNRQIGDGTDKLAENGIAVARTSAGNTDLVGTFLNVADAMAKTDDGGKKASLAFAAFGRQGIALLPVLARGRESLQELFAEADKNHEVLSQQDIEKAIEYQIKLRELRENVRGLGVDAGKHGIGILSFAVERGKDIVAGFNATVEAAQRHIPGLGVAAQSAAPGLDVLAQEAQNAVNGMASLQKAVVGAIDAQHAYDASSRAIGQAQHAVGEARYQLNALLRKGAVDTKAVQSAQDALQSSTDSLSSAQSRLAKAEEHLQQIQAGATPHDLEEAQIKAQQSTNSLARAQKDLSDLQRKHRVNALDLSDAQLRVEQAQLDQADAADALTKVQNTGTESDQNYIDAQDEVTRATHDVETAQHAQQKAAEDLQTATAGDPEFSHQVAQARDALASAEQGVADAKYAHLKAALSLADAIDLESLAFANDAGSVDYLRQQLLGLAIDYGVNIAPILAELDKYGSSTAAGQLDAKARAFAKAEAAATPQDPRVLIGDAGKAVGGPTQAGQWYQVNERGQEFFRSNSSGTVLPVGANNSPASSSAPPQITQHIYGTGDPSTTAQMTGIETGRALRTAGR